MFILHKSIFFIVFLIWDSFVFASPIENSNKILANDFLIKHLSFGWDKLVPDHSDLLLNNYSHKESDRSFLLNWQKAFGVATKNYETLVEAVLSAHFNQVTPKPDLFISKLQDSKPFIALETQYERAMLKTNILISSDKIGIKNDFLLSSLQLEFNRLKKLNEKWLVIEKSEATSNQIEGDLRERLKVAEGFIVKIKSRFRELLSFGESGVGFEWKRRFDDESHIGIKLGYDISFSTKEEQYMYLVSLSKGFFDVDGGELTFYGLKLGFRFDF